MCSSDLHPRLYYWFAVRWLVKEVNVAKMWRQSRRPYWKILRESAKVAVARAGVALVDLASLHRTEPLPLGARSMTARFSRGSDNVHS